MTSSENTGCSDLVQAAKLGDEIQGLVQSLLGSFKVESIRKAEGYSKVECLYDVSKELEDIRRLFKKDLIRSKEIANIVQAIVPRAEKKYYLSLIVRLLVFQNGWSGLEGLISKDDCIILMPVVTVGSTTGMLEERATGQQTTFTFDIGSVLVISGRCSVFMQPESKAVCVGMSIGRDKE